LQVGKRVVELQESQSDDKSNSDMGKQSSPLVIGVSPQGDIGPHEYSLELEPSRSSVLGSLSIIMIGFSLSLSLECGNLFLSPGEFLGVDPFLVPITATHSLSGSSSNSFQHEFSRVGAGWDRGTVSLEIVDEDVRVFTDITKVDTLTSSLEEQKSVKVLE